MTPLMVGDVIERRFSTGARRYVVEGWTSRGKCKLRRLDTGTEMSTWWSTRESLPGRYRFVGQVAA